MQDWDIENPSTAEYLLDVGTAIHPSDTSPTLGASLDLPFF